MIRKNEKFKQFKIRAKKGKTAFEVFMHNVTYMRASTACTPNIGNTFFYLELVRKCQQFNDSKLSADVSG